jgi:hypothetical protein
MELLRWMAKMFARFVAVSVLLVSGWMFVVNLSDRGWDPWILAWILGSGLIGALGGVLYLLSLDGPERFQTRLHRTVGWVGMLLAVLLPTSLTFMLVPLVLVLIPSLFTLRRAEDEEPVTSS